MDLKLTEMNDFTAISLQKLYTVHLCALPHLGTIHVCNIIGPFKIGDMLYSASVPQNTNVDISQDL